MSNATKNILVVDNDDELQNLLAIYLKMAGYEVFHATDEEDGKNMLKNLMPDMIILDMMMPVLDRMGFLRWLRQEAKLDVPVLAFTDSAKSDTRAIVLDFGATEVFFKPLYPEQLVLRTHKVLLLCQLVDVTQMKLQSTFKDKVAERFIFQLRNDMHSILTASQLLTSDQASDPEKRMVGGILQNKINNQLKILNEVDALLKTDPSSITSRFEAYPLDPKKPLLDAMENLADAAVERQVKLHCDLPALVSLVYAAPNELTSVITSVLVLLVDDAVENTKITIDMEELDKWLTYTFKNTGVGIPNERLQQYLFSQEVEVSKKFNDMRRAVELIKLWKGTLKAESEVDQGMSFELRLRSFI